MKKHSFFSYLFWTGAAALSGIAISSSANAGLKTTYYYLNSLGAPVVYEAKGFPLIVAKTSRASALDLDSEIIISDRRQRESGDLSKNLSLTARGYLVADIDTGNIIMEKNKDERFPIASITKLMTAIVATETINQDEVAAVPEMAMSGERQTISGLSAGEIISANDLLYPLLLQSSNPAAETLSNLTGRKKFIVNMNEKAAALELTATAFSDPSGLSSGNSSTPQDIFKMISYVFKNKKNILDITKEKEAVAGARKWFNNDKLAGLENFLGGKTGYTAAAGKTFAGAFVLPAVGRENKNIAIVLLKSADREDDVMKILDYLKENI